MSDHRNTTSAMAQSRRGAIRGLQSTCYPISRRRHHKNGENAIFMSPINRPIIEGWVAMPHSHIARPTYR